MLLILLLYLWNRVSARKNGSAVEKFQLKLTDETGFGSCCFGIRPKHRS